jgi:hypothetical protein
MTTAGCTKSSPEYSERDAHVLLMSAKHEMSPIEDSADLRAALQVVFHLLADLPRDQVRELAAVYGDDVDDKLMPIHQRPRRVVAVALLVSLYLYLLFLTFCFVFASRSHFFSFSSRLWLLPSMPLKRFR